MSRRVHALHKPPLLGYHVVNPRGGVAGPVILDTFTDTNGTAIGDHIPDTAPVGSAWANLRSSGSIVNNRLQFAEDGSAVIDAGISDCTITANVTAYMLYSNKYNRFAKILFRHNITNGTYWALTLRPGYLGLTKNAGTYYAAETSISGIADLDVVELKVVCNGTSIKGYVNNSFEVSVVDADYQTDTYVGVGCFRNYLHQYYVDNFQVNAALEGGDKA